MSRRKQSDPGEVVRKRLKSDGNAVQIQTPDVEWSQEEKTRLLEALEKDAGKNNWRSITRQVKTRDTAQVKLFTSKLRAEKQASGQRAIDPKDGGPLEAWIGMTEKLKGDDDIDGTCIPQKRTVEERKKGRKQDELHVPRHQTDSSRVHDNVDHVNDVANEASSPVKSSDLNINLQSSIESQCHLLQDFGSRMNDLLDNQIQMMAKVSQMESKLEKLCTDISLKSPDVNMLSRLSNQIDQLSRNSGHAHQCIGGSVIIHTPPHANIVHQPIVNSCGSCKANPGRTENKVENNSCPQCTIGSGREYGHIPKQRPAETVNETINTTNCTCTCEGHRSNVVNSKNSNTMPAEEQALNTGAVACSAEAQTFNTGVVQRVQPALSNMYVYHGLETPTAKKPDSSVLHSPNNHQLNVRRTPHSVTPSQSIPKEGSLVGVSHAVNRQKDILLPSAQGSLAFVVKKSNPVFDNSDTTDTMLPRQQASLHSALTSSKTTSNNTPTPSLQQILVPLTKEVSQEIHTLCMVPAKRMLPSAESPCVTIPNQKHTVIPATVSCSPYVRKITTQESHPPNWSKVPSPQPTQPNLGQQGTTTLLCSYQTVQKPESFPASVNNQRAPLHCLLTTPLKVVSQSTQPKSVAPAFTVSPPYVDATPVVLRYPIQQNKVLSNSVASTNKAEIGNTTQQQTTVPLSCDPVSAVSTTSCATASKEPEPVQSMSSSSSWGTVTSPSSRPVGVAVTSRALPSTGLVGLSDIRHRASKSATLPTMVTLPSSTVTVVQRAQPVSTVDAANDKPDDGSASLCTDLASQQECATKEVSSSNSAEKQSSYSQQDVLKAAVVISKFVSEQPNEKNQATWRSCLTGIATQYKATDDEVNEDCTTTPPAGKLPRTVVIGGNPHVVLTECELEEVLERSRGRANFFALRLAEQIFGEEVLFKSTPNGIGGKAALKPSTLEAIKAEVLHRFAEDQSDFEKKELWRHCVTSIAQRCKRARLLSKKSTCDKTQGRVDDPLCRPTMATGIARMDCEYPASDHSTASSDRDSGGLDSSAQSLSDNTSPFQLHSTSPDHQNKEELSPNRVAKVSSAVIDSDKAHSCTKDTQSSVELKSSANTGQDQEMLGDNEQVIPPGIDPDITVVHLPVSMQSTDMEVKGKSLNTDASCIEEKVERFSVENDQTENVKRKEGVESASPSEHSPASKEHKKESDSYDNVAEKDKFYGECLQVLGTIYNPSAAHASTVTVSGIKMTRDFSQVLIGGNPNVTVPRQKYLDALERSSQPTHFAVRLAELTYGDDVLEESTITGARPGTKQLDATVLDAVQTELVERLVKDESPEVQSIIWRKCLASIATRCKMLRYYKAKHHTHQALPASPLNSPGMDNI